MKKSSRLKRIIAMAAVLFLAALVLCLLILALCGAPARYLMAVLVCLVVVPVIAYAMLLAARVFGDGKE